jgi:hypothetical protein
MVVLQITTWRPLDLNFQLTEYLLLLALGISQRVTANIKQLVADKRRRSAHWLGDTAGKTRTLQTAAQNLGIRPVTLVCIGQTINVQNIWLEKLKFRIYRMF